MLGIKFTRSIIIGLVFIYLAGLCWLGELVVPFTSLSHKVAVFTALLVAGELLFVAGVAVLGKRVYRELKDRLKAYLKQPKNRQ